MNDDPNWGSNDTGIEYRVSIDTHGIERYRVSSDTTVSLRDTAG
jgi:hypothetical protein